MYLINYHFCFQQFQKSSENFWSHFDYFKICGNGKRWKSEYWFTDRILRAYMWPQIINLPRHGINYGEKKNYITGFSSLPSNRFLSNLGKNIQEDSQKCAKILKPYVEITMHEVFLYFLLYFMQIKCIK